MAKTQTDIQIVEEQITKLFELMGTDASAAVTEGEDDTIKVQIQSENEAGLLIGSHGKTIESLELLANLMFKQKKASGKEFL